VRARVAGQIVELGGNQRVKLEASKRHTVEAVVDRLVIDEKIRVRLSDSVETALRWGEGSVVLLRQLPDHRQPDEWDEERYSNRLVSPATGASFEPPTIRHFSFNSPAGACPVCHGLGQKMVFDEALVVPDPAKSIEQGAVLAWRRRSKQMITYHKVLA